ncbi:DNA repair protein RecO [Lewinella sp. W8]|uniref:DNA repair protein RecO n=1 Tax=Lewinella sp. W8 TaxID=2528208 RepID=UPI001067807F|nr:DNA repair protein RecO [Lewinella sp. W8]MTB49559.1 DNA repair protein RecO [Lewinella sp. W8]
MLIKTRGLIFRTIKYGDSSLILEVYTEEKGIRKYIVSGVRKARSRTPASLVQPMNLVDLVAYERGGKDLHRLKEVKPALVYTRIPFDVMRGTLGLFMLEVARNAIREEAENPILFNFLFDNFRFLDQTEGQIAHLHLHFLLELSAHLGFLPSGIHDQEHPLFDLKEGQFIAGFPGHTHYLDEKRSALMSNILHTPKESLDEIKSSREERVGLLQDLVQYYQFHVEGMREINSLDILREVMK